jgi:SAM-dependent methyltransferase
VTHEEEVGFIMGEVAERALHPLPLAREVRPVVLSRLEEADRHTRPHEPVAGGRLAPLRRFMGKLLGFQFERQAVFNQHTSLVLRDLETLTTILESRLRTGWINLDHRLGCAERETNRVEDRQRDVARALSASIAGLDLRLNDAEGELAGVETRWKAVFGALDALQSELEQRRAENAALRARLDALERQGARTGPGEVADQLEEPRPAASSIIDDVYVEFEEWFRGSREHVRARQQPYLTDVKDLRGGEAPVLDIGPGRCEWLEILASEGIPSYGCDLNPGMVELGRTYGVEVRAGNGIEHLQKVTPGSLGAVTAFQVVEHLSLEDLVLLLDGALTALQPGGALILETPNPTNLTVGASGFYIDPTHVRPLPPPLLEFLAKSRGFADVEVRYVNPLRGDWPPPSGDPLDPVRAEVSWWLFGPQDYAIVARKPRANGQEHHGRAGGTPA